MTGKPTADDFGRAAEWLRNYEGDGDEPADSVAAMERVAAYLDTMAGRKEAAAADAATRRAIRAELRSQGLAATPAAVAKVMARIAGNRT